MFIPGESFGPFLHAPDGLHILSEPINNMDHQNTSIQIQSQNFPEERDVLSCTESCVSCVSSNGLHYMILVEFAMSCFGCEAAFGSIVAIDLIQSDCYDTAAMDWVKNNKKQTWHNISYGVKRKELKLEQKVMILSHLSRIPWSVSEEGENGVKCKKL